jgi:succinoglycan biosynthesis protein ExoL
MVRIHCLLPVPSQPRFHKRIAAFRAAGATVRVYAFEREYFRGKAPDLNYHRLGRLQHESYRQRLPALLRVVPFLWRQTRPGDVLYGFGLDMALLGLMVHRLHGARTRLVYECGDIRPGMVGRGPGSRLLRRLERRVLAAATRVVITAPAFGSHYFTAVQGVPSSRLFLIENKLDVMPPRIPALPPWDGSRPLRLGYFGLLRDRLAWQVMRRWAQQAPQAVQILVRGYPFGIPDLREAVEAQANVHFGGEYVYPDDLPALYGHVDLVWVAYPRPVGEADDGRWRWPRTNRFYEACYFGVPMIGQTGSADGELIEGYDIGLTVDTAAPETALARLQAINPADLARWRANLAALPPELYLYTDEHERLLATLL